MMTNVKLEKTGSTEGIPGVTKKESGWGTETWSDGTHSFLLQYSPGNCNVYPPEGFTSQTVIAVAVANGIEYRLEPIIDGEVVKVGRANGEDLMYAVYEAVFSDS